MNSSGVSVKWFFLEEPVFNQIEKFINRHLNHVNIIFFLCCADLESTLLVPKLATSTSSKYKCSYIGVSLERHYFGIVYNSSWHYVFYFE